MAKAADAADTGGAGGVVLTDDATAITVAVVAVAVAVAVGSGDDDADKVTSDHFFGVKGTIRADAGILYICH